MRSLTILRTVALLVLLLAVPPLVGSTSLLEGQTSSRQGLEMSREELHMRILRGFEHQVMSLLDLDEPQIVQIREIVIENREARGRLMIERQSLSERIEVFARNEGSDTVARQLLMRDRELRERELELQRAEEDALLEVLTESELLRYLQMRSDLIDRIRELERRSRSDRNDRDRSDGSRD